MLVMSLTHRGNFVEAGDYNAEAMRLAESTHNSTTMGMALRGATTLHLVRARLVPNARQRQIEETTLRVQPERARLPTLCVLSTSGEALFTPNSYPLTVAAERLTVLGANQREFLNLVRCFYGGTAAVAQ
jgi:hypothetical protein